MGIRTAGLLVVLSVALASGPAAAGPCDAYYTFDGYLSDLGGNGYDGRMFGPDNATPTPQFANGQISAALHLNGKSAMRAFMDLHFDTCPRVTITAWIRVASNDVKASQHIVSTGGGNGPGVRIASGRNVVLEGTANGLSQRDAIRDPNQWFFVAGTWDYLEGIYKLYWRNRVVDGALSDNRRAPEDALWIGALNDGLSGPALDVWIDDLRIYGRVLGADEINRIRAAGGDFVAVEFVPTGQAVAATAPATSGPATSGQAANEYPSAAGIQTTTTAPGAVATIAEGLVCNAPGECPTGSYCAFDRTCHPDRHAPMRSIELQEIQASPVETIILDENARFEDPPEEPSAAPAAAAALGPDGGIGSLSVREALNQFSFVKEPSGDVRDCTSFAEVTGDLFTSTRDAIVELAAGIGCGLLNLPVMATVSAASVVDAAGYETDEFRERLLAETYEKCIANTVAVSQLPDKALSAWNRNIAKNSWATIGPRRLMNSNSGNIISPGDRKFITDRPYMAGNSATMTVEELDGRARITGRVCTVSVGNRYTRIMKFTMNDTPEERQNQQQYNVWALNGLKNKLLIIYLDGAGRLGRNFKYQLRME